MSEEELRQWGIKHCEHDLAVLCILGRSSNNVHPSKVLLLQRWNDLWTEYFSYQSLPALRNWRRIF